MVKTVRKGGPGLRAGDGDEKRTRERNEGVSIMMGDVHRGKEQRYG